MPRLLPSLPIGQPFEVTIVATVASIIPENPVKDGECLVSRQHISDRAVQFAIDILRSFIPCQIASAAEMPIEARVDPKATLSAAAPSSG